jgi:cysteine synthase B
MARRLAAEEGIFCGISSGGACAIALRIAAQLPGLARTQMARGAVIVFIVCDRGDRYLSTGVFNR